MRIVEQIFQRQQETFAMMIGIDGMNISGNLKERVLNALASQEDFALVCDDTGAYAYFLQEGFMVYKSVDGMSDSVTHLRDQKSWQNALKVVLLGHRKFVTQKALLLNANYVYITEALRHETKLIVV